MKFNRTSAVIDVRNRESSTVTAENKLTRQKIPSDSPLEVLCENYLKGLWF